MYETLARPMDVQQIPTPLPISAAISNLQKSEVRREEKRQRQIAESRAKHADAQKGKRKRENGTADETGSPPSDIDASGGKRIKTDEEASTSMDIDGVVPTISMLDVEDGDETEGEIPTLKNVSKIFNEVRGHTSYLTFACLLPVVTPQTEGQSHFYSPLKGVLTEQFNRSRYRCPTYRDLSFASITAFQRVCMELQE